MIEAIRTFMSLGPVMHIIWLSLTLIVAAIVLAEVHVMTLLLPPQYMLCGIGLICWVYWAWVNAN